MPFFSKVFKHKDNPTKKAKNAPRSAAANDDTRPILSRPRYVSTWESPHVVPDEVEELIHSCTLEIKSRAEALDTPFLLLPFRPDYEPGSSKSFVQNFFTANREGRQEYKGPALQQELRLSSPEVLCSIIKWCWARIPGGVVSWNVYELFRLGESESGMLRAGFDTFIPLSVPSESSKNIIYDFFDLLAAIAAHGKINGLAGSKLSRLAGWWAFALPDDTFGFDVAYKHWSLAADASSHLFFAYLRSRAPEDIDGTSGISALPRSLQALVAHTQYPPRLPAMMQSSTPRVVMIVESVSPDPFTLLRRANHFEFRDQDKILQQFANYSDPTQSLTEECRRVLQSIAATNHSSSSSAMGYRTGNESIVRSPSGLNIKSNDGWSRFQDYGFSAVSSDASGQAANRTVSPLTRSTTGLHFSPKTAASSRGRPTTPSWAEFLSEKQKPPPFLPASQSLPVLSQQRQDSANSSHDEFEHVPGELASATRIKLDDAFWWVWMTSLASEEPFKRKAAFGRCALIETTIPSGRWLVMEEQLKGAISGPEAGAYIAEKKSRFGFARRRASTRRPNPLVPGKVAKDQVSATPSDETKDLIRPKSNVSFDQQMMIKAAAVELARKTRGDKPDSKATVSTGRRGRFDEASSIKTNSMLTLGITRDVQPALKWARTYDREAARKEYLGANLTLPGAISETNLSSPTNSEQDFSRGKRDRPVSTGQLQYLPSFEKTGRQLPSLPESDPDPVVSSPLQPSDIPKVSNLTETELPPLTAAEVPLPQATRPDKPSTPTQIQDPANIPLPADTSAIHTPDAATPTLPASPVDSTGNVVLPEKDSRPRDVTASGAASENPVAPSVHPALRADVPGMTPLTAGANAAQLGARAAWKSSSSLSPPASPPRTADDSRLNKKSGGGTGALRKMFGRRKGDAAHGSSKESTLSKSPMTPGPSVGRQPSVLRKERPTSRSGVRLSPKTEAQSPVGLTVPQHLLPAGISIKATPDPLSVPARNVQATPVSPVDTLEQKAAEDHFSRFDQGISVQEPLPESHKSVNMTTDEIIPTPQQTQPETDYLTNRPTQLNRQESVYTTPMDIPAGSDDSGLVPVTEEEDDSPVDLQNVSQGERWAAIRRNVAVRTTTSENTHTSMHVERHGHDTRSNSMETGHSTEVENAKQESVHAATSPTDEGETSAEDTVDDRVARIKARVAQLTAGTKDPVLPPSSMAPVPDSDPIT